MTKTTLISMQRRHESRMVLTLFAVLAAIAIIIGWQQIIAHPAQVSIILISAYIFYFVNKNTYDTMLALAATIIWGAGVMYFVTAVAMPGIAAMQGGTILNDLINAMYQLAYMLR